jgi:hypothetical protein
MFRLTIKLVIAGLLAHAAYRVVPPFVNHYQFQDAVEEALRHQNTTSFSGKRQSPEQLLDKLAKTAEEMNVPLTRQDFRLQFGSDATTLDARYTVQLEYLPRQFKPHEFVIHAEGEPSRFRASIGR